MNAAAYYRRRKTTLSSTYFHFIPQEIISNTCYISFICAFYHASTSYRFYAVTALPPLIEYVHYFHTKAGFRTRKTAAKNSYYKINHCMHRKTHLITWNGAPLLLHYLYIYALSQYTFHERLWKSIRYHRFLCFLSRKWKKCIILKSFRNVLYINYQIKKLDFVFCTFL